MNIQEACESFKKLLQEQQERIEKMNSQKVDFSAKETVTIGIIDGDGIGPIIVDGAAKILEKLLATPDLRSTKCHIAIKPKTGKKGYRKDYHKRQDVWRDDHNAQIDKLLTYNEVVNQKVPHRIQPHIQHTACTISEHRLRQQSSKRSNIEQIDGFSYESRERHLFFPNGLYIPTYP